MARLKEWLTKLSCMVLCACILGGCEKAVDRNEGVEKQEENISNNNMEENSDKGGIDPLDKTENSLINNENLSEDSEEPGDDIKSSLKDSTKEPEITNMVVSDIKFEPLENYRERNIPSVYTKEKNNEYYCNVLLNAKNQIEYYTYVREEDGCHFYKYTLIENNEKQDSASYWEKEALSWCEGFGKEIGLGEDWVKVFTGEDGNDYAWYLGTDEKAHFVKRVKTLNETESGVREEDSYAEITGLDWSYSNFVELAVLLNGNIVMTDLSKKCSVYSGEDGHLLERFQCGFYWGLCVEENQIYIGDSTGASVQHYNAEKQEFMPLIKANFDTTIRIAVQEDDVYVCNVHGIYRAKKEGGEFQKILDAGTFHFAKESGTLLKFFVIGDAFYVVYGEDGISIKKYSPAGEGDVIANSLNIYSLDKNEVVLDMISEYQNMYPNTEIIYETGEGAEGSITVADRIRALNARILAGDGPDIILMDGLPVDSYKKKGILADLNPVLGNLKEELTPNILSAYMQEDKLYLLPARFSVPFFLSCEKNRERYATLDALAEYSEENGGIMSSNFCYLDYFEMLYYNYPPELVTETGEVNREDITKFLELLKRICESENAAESGNWPTIYLRGYNFSQAFARGQIDFIFVHLLGETSLSTYPSALKIREGEMLPNKEIFFPNTLFAISSLSLKPKLAASFLQFAFSYDVQGRYVGSAGYPIHIKVLDDLAERDMSDYGLYDGTITLQEAGKEENAKMIEYVRTVRTPFTVDASIRDIVENGAMEYLNGKSKLSESVEAVVSKIQMYLYEQQ